jgi:hypothetical protein
VTTNYKETAVQSALQPYATAGVAIVGASLIAVTPVAAPLPGIHTIRDVALTAGDDDSSSGGFFEPFIDPFNTASDNGAQLIHNFGAAPFVGAQQFIVNQAGFLQDFFNDPTSSNLADITEQIQDNLKSVITGFTGIDMSDDTQSVVFDHTLSTGDNIVSKAQLLGLLPGFLPGDIDPDQVTTILDFLASPLSGIIIGELGPFISPFVALMNSLNDGDGFSETLANVVGAYFNGATLNLDSLIPAIQDADILPGDFDINHLDFAFGGLLSTGEVSIGDYGVPTQFVADGTDDDGNPEPVDFDTVTSVGGSIFNSLGADIGGVPVVGNLVLDSHPIGPLGAMIGASETIGVLLGDGWDNEVKLGSGKDAPTIHGPATPPLVHLISPNLPDDFFENGSDGGAPSTEAVDFLSGNDTLGDWLGF